MVGEWEKKPLSSIGNFINGRAFKPNEWTSKGLPIIRIANLNNPEMKFDFFDGNVDGKHVVEKGDILLSWSASLGAYLWKKDRAVVNQHIFKVVPNSDVNKNFAFFLLERSVERLKEKVHGSTMKHIKKGELDELFVFIPPLLEQTKIASILTTVDDAIEKTEAIIEQTEKVKKGLMQQLFTKGIGHTKFKKTVIGEIPEEWGVYKIKDISRKVTDGEHKTPKRSAQGEYLLSARNVKNGRLDLTDVDFVPEKEFRKITKRCNPENGDILVSCSGTIGNVCVVPENIKFALVRSVALIKPIFGLINSKYLMYMLQLPKLQSFMRINQSQLAQANLFLRDIKMLPIICPPLREQQEIVGILSSVDDKINKEQAKLTKLQTIKKGLMQVLLTGKVRVNINEQDNKVTES